ncbi:hypothetical protein [uncultured Nocardioides sp.]|uniref:hypothetical protein n=1 Tax=uncultured Nocardioides sp. TaxID=198441 RepID=UPI0026B37472
MTSWAKVLVGVVLGLPMGAYALGSLVASSADPPPARSPIILEDAPAPSPGTTPGATLTPQPTPRVSPGPPEVVVPGYVDRDDDDERDEDRDDEDGDDEDGDDEDGDDEDGDDEDGDDD